MHCRGFSVNRDTKEEALRQEVLEKAREKALGKAQELQAFGRLMLPEELYVQQEVKGALQEFDKTLSSAKASLEKALQILAGELELLPSIEKEEIQKQFSRAFALFSSGDKQEELEEGKVSLQEICEIRDEVLLWIYHIGHQHFIARRYEESLSLFFLLTLLNSFVCDYWLALGLTQKECRQEEEALYSLTIASQLRPEDPSILLHIAELSHAMGHVEQSRQELQKAGDLLKQGGDPAQREAFLHAQQQIEQTKKPSQQHI